MMSTSPATPPQMPPTRAPVAGMPLLPPAPELAVVDALEGPPDVGLPPAKPSLPVPDAEAIFEEETSSNMELETVGVLVMSVDGVEVMEVRSSESVDDVVCTVESEDVDAVKAPNRPDDSVAELMVEVDWRELLNVAVLRGRDVKVEFVPVS